MLAQLPELRLFYSLDTVLRLFQLLRAGNDQHGTLVHALRRPPVRGRPVGLSTTCSDNTILAHHPNMACVSTALQQQSMAKNKRTKN